MESRSVVYAGVQKFPTKCTPNVADSGGSAGDAGLLSRRYEELLRAEKYCDCIFHVCGTRVHCHKLILSAASPVFEAMFYGPLHEQQHDIEILDISVEVFQTLVAYIYTGGVDYQLLTLAQTIELYYSAEKYLLDALVDDCLQAAARKLRYTNILPAMELSVRMHLDKLLEVCLCFFRRCCLHDAQFRLQLKANYVHVSKDCVKVLLGGLQRAQQQQLLWYVLLWCQHECGEFGDSALAELKLADLSTPDVDAAPVLTHCYTRERCYYKACRPFCIDYDSCVWRLQLQCDRFVRLVGIVMPSRLMPHGRQHLPNEYQEQLSIEISALAPQEQAEESAVIWRHSVLQRDNKYNCDLTINWEPGVVLSPDVVYELALRWPAQAYGAEYPCSLLSNVVDGIQLCDSTAHQGSLIKGLRLTDLI